MERRQDPVSPGVTFDSYVIPETVRREIRVQPVLPVSGMMIAVSVIAVLTFALGVMAALKFSGPAPQMAVMPDVPPDVPNVAPAPSSVAPPEPEPAVTRQQAPDLISTGSSVLDNAPALPSTELETAVLKGLTIKRTIGKLTPDEMAQRALEAQAIVNRNKLRMLREGVMAGVYRVKAHKDEGIKRLVLTTVNAEMTRASMGNLLVAAAERGEIEIPPSLSTSNGDIDMDTMLFNLIQTSLMNDGTVEGAEAAREMSRRAFAASDSTTREIRGQRVYIVKPGDSLAYIALQFYGRPSAYKRIFDANREQLETPELIQTGQRLIIPG